jgi:hypothetical protein
LKDITTLVQDIYNLFESGAVDKNAFDKMLSAPQNIGERESDNHLLRMSNLGTSCERELWFKVNAKDQGIPFRAPHLIKFMFGDILESFLLQLAVMAGHSVEGAQDQLEINGVKGHRDAIIDGYLVDVKSASTYSFKKFEEGLTPDNDPFSYIPQINLYLKASENDPRLIHKNRAFFLVIDKTLGNICLSEAPIIRQDWHKFVEQKKQVVAAKNPPPRVIPAEPDGKSGNMKLGTKCSYCAFPYRCYEGEGLRTFIYSDGPRYLTRVVNEPKVPEVKNV